MMMMMMMMMMMKMKMKLMKGYIQLLILFIGSLICTSFNTNTNRIIYRNSNSIPVIHRLNSRLLMNIDERINLDISIESMGFLKNIKEYGKNRMARRAVGILSKMPSYKCLPQEIHYTATLWACENSDQFNLAVGVYEEMKAEGIVPTISTFEALTSVAEKTGHWEESLSFLKEMDDLKIKGSTFLFNKCMWSVDKGGHHEVALELLKRMEAENIERDEETYAACVWACEKGGEGEIALHVVDLMKQDGIPLDTQTYKAVMWACVKGGLWQTALDLYNEMIKNRNYIDQDCSNAAIWSYEQGDQWDKTIEVLKTMKYEKIALSTMSFDGAISACCKAGEWQQCLDLFAWMDREVPVIEKSHITYKLLIEALDAAKKDKQVTEIYFRAMREGFYIPWVGNTRQVDLRGMSLPLAKAAINNILMSMRKGTLPIFNLSIIYADVLNDDDGRYKIVSPFVIEEFEEYLDCLEPAGVLTPLSRECDVDTNTERIVIYANALSIWSYKNV